MVINLAFRHAESTFCQYLGLAKLATFLPKITTVSIKRLDFEKKTRGSEIPEYMSQLKCHTAATHNFFNPRTYSSAQEQVTLKNDRVIVSKKWEYRSILVIEHAA